MKCSQHFNTTLHAFRSNYGISILPEDTWTCCLKGIGIEPLTLRLVDADLPRDSQPLHIIC